MRTKSLENKLVYYCKRFPEPYAGSYFEFFENKVCCNPRENFPFRMKIGGIVYLKRKKVIGKNISTAAERIKDSQHFGSYVFISDIDHKIRTILYARYNGLTDKKWISRPGVLHNVIPRYDGQSSIESVIIGMKIRETQDGNRQWTHFDGNYDKNRYNRGFFEIKDLQNMNDMIFEDLDEITYGIYVTQNTSLLMVDVTQPNLYSDYCRDYVYTLFQEGAFVCSNRPLSFRFYDIEEKEDFSCIELIQQKSQVLNETPNLEQLIDSSVRGKHFIIFLKSAPNYTFWTLRVTRQWIGRPKNVQLCIPTGGQFADILPWDAGILEVGRRQELKPWRKYIEPLNTKEKLSQFVERIDVNSDEPYPRMKVKSNSVSQN